VTTLKLHYDGWLALPADFRRKLGLGKGQALEAQLVGGTIVLRPAGMKAAEAVEVEVELEPELAPEPALMEPAAAEAPAKPRARRKQATATTATATLPPALKSRGRKARAADGAQGS
jgi:bifunctional DNA-binding transcriptional regulator/antitoxin component of YhaV-PrlF toxin-antitoxin module